MTTPILTRLRRALCRHDWLPMLDWPRPLRHAYRIPQGDA